MWGATANLHGRRGLRAGSDARPAGVAAAPGGYSANTLSHGRNRAALSPSGISANRGRNATAASSTAGAASRRASASSWSLRPAPSCCTVRAAEVRRPRPDPDTHPVEIRLLRGDRRQATSRRPLAQATSRAGSPSACSAASASRSPRSRRGRRANSASTEGSGFACYSTSDRQRRAGHGRLGPIVSRSERARHGHRVAPRCMTPHGHCAASAPASDAREDGKSAASPRMSFRRSRRSGAAWPGPCHGPAA